MNVNEFARRRQHLMELIGPNGIAVVVAAPEQVRSRDTHFNYRPDSDFYYLTGFREPEAVAVLVPGRAQGEFLLFCRDRNPEREQWDGARTGPEGAVAAYGADDAFPITDLDDILPGLLDLQKASGLQPTMFQQLERSLPIDARPTAPATTRRKLLEKELLVKGAPLAVDPAVAERTVQGFGIADGGDARAPLRDLEPEPPAVLVMQRQPGLPLLLGGECYDR